ncbi:uncharacterized protein LOC143887894 [Tasmannia lanceolata]|uniref:uncharacterized protein LOC143887894 n=1 Tax=Tasmannia lanceolata TaxID=3420 RepID=UPI004062B73E
MSTSSNKRDKSKYCRYHKDHGHDTNECRHFKEEIELLIKRGHLRKYVRNGGLEKREPRIPSPGRRKSPQRSPSRGSRAKSPAPASPPAIEPSFEPTGVSMTIVGGPAAGGTSSAARRAHAHQVNSVHIPDKKLKANNTISFSYADLNDVILPHNDALVITMLIASFEMPRILVDNGSSADILYYHTFKQLGIKDNLLKPSSTKLYGFAGEVVRVVGSIELPVLMVSAPPRATAMV